MRRLSLLICLLISCELSNTQPTQSPDAHASRNSKDASTHGSETTKVNHPSRTEPHVEEVPGVDEAEGGHTHGGSEGSREVAVDHGDAEEDSDREEVEGEEVNPDDDSDDDDKDEVLAVNYRLPEGKPWKEERFTSDWLYSMKTPSLTAEVHWHCPFYIDEGEKDPEKKRKRSDDTECVTIAQLKYWHTHLDTPTEVLLDKFRITYVPTYVLLKQNALKFIVPRKVEENRVTVDVALNYHSETITCEQIIYEVQDHGQVKVSKGNKPECKKGGSVTTTEWVWEADDDDEEADFKYEAQYEEKDQDEEEEHHVTSPHAYEHGRQNSGTMDIGNHGKHVASEGRRESTGSQHATSR